MLLLAAWPATLTLEGAAAAWLLSFVAYAAFNLAAVFSPRSASASP